MTEQIENTLTSLEVAEMVDKTHNMVLRDIRRIVDQLAVSKNAPSVYFVENTYEDSTGRNLPCYLLTKKGCELFSTRMTGARGTQFAVAYIERFNQMEQHIRQQNDYSELSPELQMFNQMFQAVANNEKRMNEIDYKVDAIKDVVSLSTANWRDDMSKLIRRMAYKLGGGLVYQQIQSEIYAEVERRGGFKFDRRLRNMQTRQIEAGYSKSAVRKINKVDVIEADKRAIQIYIQVVKEFAIKYEIDVA